MNLKINRILKSIALALSITITLPLSSIVSAEQHAIQEPELVAESALTMDMETGEVIYAKNADTQMSIASTTKLLTALLFAEQKAKTDLIPFTQEASEQPEASLNVNYKKMNIGDTLTAEDAMEALLIYSANDVAYMMAESVSGSVSDFVDLMNNRVKELGLKNTHFSNPNGLEKGGENYNYSTAFDLAIIAKAAYQNDWIREVVAAKDEEKKVNINGSTVLLQTRNKILGKDGNVGGKTGLETNAGHCFVGYYNRDGRKLITVVLKSQYGADGLSVFNDTEKIANYSYSDNKEVYKKSGDVVGQTTLEYKIFRFFGPKNTITVPIVLTQDVECYKNSLNDNNATFEYLGSEKNAWKLTGDEDINLSFNLPGHTENVSGIAEISVSELLKANISFYLAFIIVIVIAIVLVLVIMRIIKMRKRRYRRRY